MHVVAFLLGLVACEAAVSTTVSINQRKERLIREPIPIRPPSSYQGGVLADRITRQGPVTRWTTFESDTGDMQLYYFHNITFKTHAKKTLLGIWKGYEGDQTKNVYRSIVFDDGDRCRGAPDRRYSIVVEISKKEYKGVTDYMEAIESTSDPCVFTSKINLFTTDALLQLPSAFETDADVGIVQWYDDPNAPDKLCRDIKCNYSSIEMSIQDAVQEIAILRARLADHDTHTDDAIGAVMESSSSILMAANGVLTQSLRVFEHLKHFHTLAPPTCTLMSTARPPDELPALPDDTAAVADPAGDAIQSRTGP
ncbi:hypothetical protein H310_08027 [Aphanomyces invadans]|uniref:Uncharacterized protein n=1 Tax=Aphanomyces invadans TaxID=157072 RepID=A0A024TYQ9_9STRA|nr:hypothetical protein H310_08027 [Aphanomyces invadans]ETV99295.1 hypothetical protein H310_08027 [Aphanomyces invadans]|eukprot:XP_008871851.1 hypothetical protein H310_08027 [Aphanomyces invadans]